MSGKRPTVLLVLDGWGHAEATDFNAITRAPAENFLRWWNECPHSLLSASGREVGLPLGLMGNSEVGHTNIGAGRVVNQTISLIDKAIENGEFRLNPALRGTIEHARKNNSRLHLFGLLGPGGVHAIDSHYEVLLQMAKELGLSSEQVRLHLLLDGRDTPPTSAKDYLHQLEQMLAKHGGVIASVCGRFYGMDSAQRWYRTELFWNCMMHAKADYRANTAQQALAAAAERGESDEFVMPTIIGEANAIADGDSVLCFNFRSDRVRQISEAILTSSFSNFETGKVPNLHYATMTQYRKDFSCAVAFPPQELRSMFGELVSAQGMRQFRCAETEKYAHVTFFFNGGREDVYPGEDRHLVASPKIPTYDLQPEMSAPQVCDEVCIRLEKNQHDLYVVNFANSDMVGHTGKQNATEAAIRAVDNCLGRIVEQTMKQGGTVAITADHGNSEQMRDPDTGGIHTAHTVNPVPFILIGEEYRNAQMREMGVLADVAPTLMRTMGIDQPSEMDGHDLLK